MLKSITFEVVGDQQLVCESCELRVKKLLKGLPGVDKVRASSNDQRIDVLFESGTVDAAAIAGRLDAAGYATKVAPSAPEGA